MTDGTLIRLRRPRLPAADELLPYLRSIDEGAQYSNFGPLAEAFEARLAKWFGLPRPGVVTTCNGTCGLALALRECGLPGRRYCALPAFTFPASVGAVIEAGFEPLFVDICAGSLAIRSGEIEALVAEGWDIAAVQPVSPFGRPLPLRDWEAFRERTGIPVVIDAAWCFDSLSASPLPQVVSLHATKVLGIGEGGVVVSQDQGLAARLRQASQFGLDAERRVVRAAGNAKLSEYAAAVGMAALDQWPDRRAMFCAVHRAYGERLSRCRAVERVLTDDGNRWVTATVAVELSATDAPACAREMTAAGIEARAGWGTLPCHRHPAHTVWPCGPMRNTDMASSRILRLPLEDYMDEDRIERVVVALDEAAARVGDGGPA